MFVRWRMLLCTLAVLSLVNVHLVNARKSFGGRGGGFSSRPSHGYPSSGGLSGGGGHRYPSSGGLSGGSNHGSPSSGGSHGYSSSGGMSGSSHGYPSSGGMSGGSHGYPSSGGMSGGSHGYPSGGMSGGSHGYPSSGGMSGGSSGYPSGGTYKNPSSGTHTYPSSGKTTHTTTVHHHYHYSPPQQIRYIPPSGGPAVNYPVYRQNPPNYVYHVKDSGSKYGTLLAGLALLNLGTLAGVAYAHSGSSHSGTTYKASPGEKCYFGLKKENGDYEQTLIECQLMSSFILQEEAKPQNTSTNTTITTTTVTNVTMVNMTNGVPEVAPSVPPLVNYTMMPNGTLVPISTYVNTTVNGTANGNNTVTSSVTITTINTTTTNALDVKGDPITVTSGMQCFVIRTTPTSRMKKSVPCRLLQTYANTSFKTNKPNSAVRNAPVLMLLAVVIASCLVY